jgi:hypothetical protein
MKQLKWQTLHGTKDEAAEALMNYIKAVYGDRLIANAQLEYFSMIIMIEANLTKTKNADKEKEAYRAALLAELAKLDEEDAK